MLISQMTGPSEPFVAETTASERFVEIRQICDIAGDFYIQWPAPAPLVDVREGGSSYVKRYRQLVVSEIRRLISSVQITVGGAPIFWADGHAIALLAMMYQPQWLAGTGDSLPLPTFGLRLPVIALAHHRCEMELRVDGEPSQFAQKSRAIASLIYRRLAGTLGCVLSSGPVSIVIDYLRTGSSTGNLPGNPVRFGGSHTFLGGIPRDELTKNDYKVPNFTITVLGKTALHSRQTRLRVNLISDAPALLQVFYFIERDGDWEDPNLLDIIAESHLSMHNVDRSAADGNYSLHVDKATNRLWPAPCHSFTLVTPDEFRNEPSKRGRAIPAKQLDNLELRIRLKKSVGDGCSLRVYGVVANQLCFRNGLGGIGLGHDVGLETSDTAA